MKDFSFAILSEANFRMVDNYFDLGRASFLRSLLEKDGLAVLTILEWRKSLFSEPKGI